MYKTIITLFLSFFVMKNALLAQNKTTMDVHFRRFYKKTFPKEYQSDPKCLVNYLKVCKKLIGDSPIIFEAGGFDGTDTEKFAKTFPKGLIITFEPNPDSYKMLEERVSKYKNVWPNQLAVNNEEGKVLFYVCHGTYGKNPIFAGASSILEPTKDMEVHYMGPRIYVPCVILDNWCIKNEVDHIDFMWLDLEGLELRVLKSSPNILKSVKIIYSETNFFEFRKGTVQFEDLKNFLKRHGFLMVVHWHSNLQGNAIFIKKSVLHKHGI